MESLKNPLLLLLFISSKINILPLHSNMVLWGTVMDLLYILGFWDYHDTLPWTGYLKSTEIYWLRVIGTRSSKFTCRHGHASLMVLGNNPSLPLPSFGWQPLVLCVPWIVAVSFQCPSLPSCGVSFLCHFVFWWGQHSSWIRPSLIKNDLILN